MVLLLVAVPMAHRIAECRHLSGCRPHLRQIPFFFRWM